MMTHNKSAIRNLPSAICLLLACLAPVAKGQVVPPGVIPNPAFANTIPSQLYYRAVDEIYRGGYRDAERALAREIRGAVRFGVTDRWIDSICYHAMWGEVLYHQGRLPQALEQFNEACSMYLAYPRWLLQVDFKQDPRVDVSRSRRLPPWGVSKRRFTLGDFSRVMLIQMGDDLAGQQQAVQQGGVLRQAQYWQVDGIEIIRATALAIRRRNELLGPLAKHDPLTRELVNKLSGGFAPPNHWSNAWADILLGLAYVGQGSLDQAMTRLERGERVAGQFDHPLTCVSLLERGRLAMEAGKTELADELLAEASYSAFYYEDPGTIDEAFRLASMNRLAASPPVPNPQLDPAAVWAQRERYDHIFARLSFARAEEWMVAGDWKSAAATLKGGQARLGNAAAGLLGNWSRYLEARLDAELEKPSAAELAVAAVADEIAMSPRTLQLQIADSWFDRQQLRASSASEVYETLLSDPTSKDWAFRPLECLAWLRTPLDPSFERWLAALAERREKNAALEVTDLAKRHRFFTVLPMGGRLAALRDSLDAPANTLSPTEQSYRRDVLLRYPDYESLLHEGKVLQESLREKWRPEMTTEALQTLTQQWREWSESLAAREQLLLRMGLSRTASRFYFPPVLSVEQLQSHLQPGQAVVVFHDTADGLFGFLLTDRASTVWNCGPSGSLAKALSQFLRDLGNHDRNHDLDDKELASNEWLESGQELFNALFEGSSIDPDSLDELIVVPDGLVWYVPLAALPVKLEDKVEPLTSLALVRVVPTMGLAFGHALPWRRMQHTSVVGSEIAPGDKEQDRAEAIKPLLEAMTNPISLPNPSHADSPTIASLLEMLVVLDEFDIERSEPLDWSPMPGLRDGADGTLAAWMTLPRTGPQRLVFAGAHTTVENGGKTSRRRKDDLPPGSELFLASCGLMSSGAQTILLSRWRVGGQSTLELMREFVREVPRTSAADAWKRCIEVAKELPLEAGAELRVKTSATGDLPTAAHPFFWAGYLLIDTGEPIVEQPAADTLP